ncbi:hypothetical protein OAI29_06490 [Amylibacter sp.]|nr:hypothetical protein [Amylibacter sp.]
MGFNLNEKVFSHSLDVQLVIQALFLHSKGRPEAYFVYLTTPVFGMVCANVAYSNRIA